MALVDPYLEKYSEGVLEIATSVKVMIAKAKLRSSNLFMIFLELEDPYDNVNHSAVMEALVRIPMASVVKEFVMNGQELRSPGRGIMNHIECEMSRMVLALCMNPVIKAVDQSKGFPISANSKLACKAFVEKMVLISATEEDMKEHLRKVGDSLKAVGLDKIDAGNCRYVAITFNNGQINVRNDLDFKLADQVIRGVSKSESWKFLGKTFVVN